MKFKIISVAMGDHRIFFKVKVKRFLFWTTLQESDGCGNGFDGEYQTTREAEEAIDRHKKNLLSKKVLVSFDVKTLK